MYYRIPKTKNKLRNEFTNKAQINPDARLLTTYMQGIFDYIYYIRDIELGIGDVVAYIDKTIRFFLTEDEFQKYVIDKHEIEY